MEINFARSKFCSSLVIGTTTIYSTLEIHVSKKHSKLLCTGHSTVCLYVKNCRSCQVNKSCSQKYGKLPAKLATITPWEAVCVNLIRPYMLRGKDGTEIDFMCLTMIDPASSWFEIIELPVVEPSLPLRVRLRQSHMIKLRKHTLTNL